MVLENTLVQAPNVVVVDPRFDSYGALVESARSGRIGLHFRSSGGDALRLARRHSVDAWLVAADLDDMSGLDFVELLRRHLGEQRTSPLHGQDARVAIVSETPGSPGHWEALEQGADHTFSKPISLADLEQFLGMTAAEREMVLPHSHLARALLTLPVSLGAAAVSIAVVMLG